MASRPHPSYTLHAEGGPIGSTKISASSAFRALRDYRHLRRSRWPVIIITDPKGRVTDEAALLRRVTVTGNAERSSSSVRGEAEQRQT